MPTNNNTSIAQRIRDVFRIQQAVEEVPNQVASSILPVVDVTPKIQMLHTQGNANDTTGSTIHTISSTKNTYLVSASLSVSKSNLNPGIRSELTAPSEFSKGAGDTIIMLKYEPLTAGSHNGQIVFPIPVKLKRGGNITITNNSGTASIDNTGVVFYYEEEI